MEKKITAVLSGRVGSLTFRLLLFSTINEGSLSDALVPNVTGHHVFSFRAYAHLDCNYNKSIHFICQTLFVGI